MNGPSSAAAQPHRQIAFFLRALWQQDVRVRAMASGLRDDARQRPGIDGNAIRLPHAMLPAEGAAGAIARAAAAHAGAHLMFTPGRFSPTGLTPLQVALVSLIEDARVEQLAMREFPGLRNLWTPFHVAKPGGVTTAMSRFARLARALIDDDYEDDEPWVQQGRRLFLDRRKDWGDPSISRAIGSQLGDALAPIRLAFSFAAYAVEPAYRDDNLGIWDFGDHGEPGGDTDPVPPGAQRPGGGEGRARDRTGDGRSPDSNSETAGLSVTLAQKEAPEEPLSPPIRYDEWDYLIGRERPAWCTLLERAATEGDSHHIDDLLERNHDLVNRLKHLVRAVQVQRPVRLRKRIEGDRLDLDACINASIDLRAGIPPDPRVHAIVGRQQRDLSVLVLLDLSQSTNDLVPNAGTTVLELAREATALLADAMGRIGDSFAIHGFSSNGRHDVGYYRFKDFDRPYGELAKSRLAGMTGQLSTRMGTALRHAGHYLNERRAHKKLVLLITDGEPSDIDVHDPHYLVLDAKKAVEENQRHGIYTYCMSLDPKADRYVSRIFGQRNWTVMDHIRRLPEKLPILYMRLTH